MNYFKVYRMHLLAVAVAVAVAVAILSLFSSPSQLFAQQKASAQMGRIVVEDRGFSIEPPKDWEVQQDDPNLTLFMQVKEGAYDTYQRSIQVKYGVRPVVMDDYGREEFGKLLVENRAKAFGSQSGYRIRNSMPIKLADGNPGILYYTEFKFEDFSMMEMHILTSSQTGHFLITYTDLAKNFENNGPGTHLDIAYKSMISAQLDTQVGGRYDFLIQVGIVLLGFFVFWVALRFYQGRQALSFIEDGPDDDAELPLEDNSDDIPKSDAEAYFSDPPRRRGGLDDIEEVREEEASWELAEADADEEKEGKKGDMAN